MCEEQAQGNGATTVRVMRHRTRARRGAGIPATKYRAADCGCSAREESRFSSKRETNTCAVSPAPEGAKRGHGRGRSGAEPSKTRRVAQDCDPKAYMYTPSGRKDALIGRLSRASTVAPTVTAHWKANQHQAQTTTPSTAYRCERQNLRLRERITKSAPMRMARTHETPITIANALPCCWNGSGIFMP